MSSRQDFTIFTHKNTYRYIFAIHFSDIIHMVKKVVFIIISLFLLSGVVASCFAARYVYAKVKYKNAQLLKMQQQINTITKQLEEEKKKSEEKIISTPTPTVAIKKTQQIQSGTVSNTNKIPVYVSQLGKTYNCDSVGVSVINQANSYAEKQQDDFNRCFDNTKKVIRAQVEGCANNCRTMCIEDIVTFDTCIDLCFNNCKNRLSYDDCENYRPNKTNLTNLVSQYCN